MKKLTKPRIGRPPIDPADLKKPVGFRLHPDTIAQLADVAQALDESQADVLTRLIAREHKRVSRKSR